MGPPWSPMMALVAVLVAGLVRIFEPLPAMATPTAIVAPFTAAERGLAPPRSTIADTTGETLMRFRDWIVESYERAPALMLGLGVLLLVPPLALVGAALRRSRRTEGQTVVVRRSRRSATRTGGRTRTGDAPPTWPHEAWIEIEGRSGKRHTLGRGLVRIGRDEDNEIRLTEKTVHRTHAVIHRTPDAEFVITDLSGSEGNGVMVNGRRVIETRLKPGDAISLGEVTLSFNTRPK